MILYDVIWFYMILYDFKWFYDIYIYMILYVPICPVTPHPADTCGAFGLTPPSKAVPVHVIS